MIDLSRSQAINYFQIENQRLRFSREQSLRDKQRFTMSLTVSNRMKARLKIILGQKHCT